MMSRLFTPAIASAYEAAYAEKGIKIVKGDVVTSLDGEGGKVTAWFGLVLSGSPLHARIVDSLAH